MEPQDNESLTKLNFIEFIRRIAQRKSLHVVVSTSLVTTITLLFLRFIGGLQPAELKLFDLLMQLRPPEPPDPRIVIIEITEPDVQAQFSRGEEGNSSVLKDSSLNKLLQKLEKGSPRVVGLDLYRDFPVHPSEPSLRDRLKHNNWLVTVCKLPEVDESLEVKDKGLSHPSDIPLKDLSKRVGFADLLKDNDDVVRRHFMIAESFPQTKCIVEQAFSLVIALQYLNGEKEFSYQQPKSPDDLLTINSKEFKPVKPFYGGYQWLSPYGYSILLNYRQTDGGPSNIAAQKISLEKFLSDSFSVEAIRNKIVLIGATEIKANSDIWTTPYGVSIPGVLVHAHEVSQIISAALDKDNRLLLWCWPQYYEFIWIFGWAILGGIFSLDSRLWRLLIISGCSILFLCVICYFALVKTGGWLPLIPPILSYSFTSGIVFYRLCSFRE
ncbi:MAG: CHASE2 domain-containing protein [Calothrix sp. MO_167.B42]|nr:CHASE2 domain-containing protein [Calothrix sp. MO_167.B42]